MDHKEEIEKLNRRIAGLEKTLQIVSRHSGKIEDNLKQLFEVVSDTMPVPMLITLSEGDILFSNIKAQEIFGYSEDDFYKIKAADMYEDKKERNRFLNILINNGEVKNFAVSLKKSDGSIFPASFFSHEIVFEGSNCILTAIYDLSDLKKEEEKRMAIERHLRQTQKMEAIGTMASGIAHDFNNILMIIFGKIELAMMMLPEDSKSRKNLSDALTAANRAKAMIIQLLDFCRQKDQERKLFCVSTIVKEAVRMIKTLISANIAVNLRIESQSPIIRGDPVQIHQVLMNLCSNANHVLQEKGGIIEIILTEINLNESNRNQIIIPKLKPGNYVRLTVSDNGPGMDKGIIDRVFDPFFTTKRQGEGTGMGLAVVHGIVQNHGGAVSVESEPGKGAAFHCYFPVVAEIESVVENEIISDKIKGGKETILFVDDEADILDVCGEMLKNLGYDIISSSVSKEALKIFQDQPEKFDLLITDMTMPEMSGKRMALEILKIRPDIPVIVITGKKVEDEILFKITDGNIIQKPFSQLEIGSVIRRVLDKKQEKKDG